VILLALIILAAPVIVGVVGVLHNAGSAHALTHGFSVFGYHVTGSTGTLFLYGIVVGAVAALGLSLLLASARRTSRRGSAARHSLKQSRRETGAASRDRDDLINQRDDLIDQRDTARAQTARAQENGPVGGDREHSAGGAR
jgi:hypothetical protein